MAKQSKPKKKPSAPNPLGRPPYNTNVWPPQNSSACKNAQPNVWPPQNSSACSPAQPYSSASNPAVNALRTIAGKTDIAGGLKIDDALQEQLNLGLNIVDAIKKVYKKNAPAKLALLNKSQIKYFLDYEQYKSGPKAKKLLSALQSNGITLKSLGFKDDYIERVNSGRELNDTEEGRFLSTATQILASEGEVKPKDLDAITSQKETPSQLPTEGPGSISDIVNNTNTSNTNNYTYMEGQKNSTDQTDQTDSVNDITDTGETPDTLYQKFIDAVSGKFGNEFLNLNTQGKKTGDKLRSLGDDVSKLGPLFTQGTRDSADALRSGVDYSGELGELGTLQGTYQGIADKNDPRFAVFEAARRANLDAEELKQRGQISSFFSRRGLGGTGAALTAENNAVDAFGRQRDELNAGLGLQQLTRQDQALASIGQLVGQKAGLRGSEFTSKMQGVQNKANMEQAGGAFGLQKLQQQAGLEGSALEAQNLGLSGMTAFLQNLLAPKSISISEQAANIGKPTSGSTNNYTAPDGSFDLDSYLANVDEEEGTTIKDSNSGKSPFSFLFG